MNVFLSCYCRIFQMVLKLALPVLPYRNPRILPKVTDIPAVLQEQGKRKPLIVTDQGIRSLGLTEGLEQVLRKNGLPFELYDRVVANPTTDNVEEALEIYGREKCDCLIAFGGGSPMDCAKGVGARIARPGKQLNDLKGILKVLRRIPLLIAIPTTAGTGSETTLACVIVDGKTRHKYAINDFPLIPSYAVLDETVTKTLPPAVTATTGMDALTHAIEAYIGKGGSRETRRDALEAIRLVFENLEEAYKAATPTARKNMLVAAHVAGRAFTRAYVGYVHALAHALGGRYDTPHGLANAVLLPLVLREYGPSIHKRLQEIALFCGLTDPSTTREEAAERVIRRIEALNETFRIPKCLTMIQEVDIPLLADYAYKEANPLYPVPVLWDRRKLQEMYRKAAGPGIGQAAA